MWDIAHIGAFIAPAKNHGRKSKDFLSSTPDFFVSFFLNFCRQPQRWMAKIGRCETNLRRQNPQSINQDWLSNIKSSSSSGSITITDSLFLLVNCNCNCSCAKLNDRWSRATTRRKVSIQFNSGSSIIRIIGASPSILQSIIRHGPREGRSLRPIPQHLHLHGITHLQSPLCRHRQPRSQRLHEIRRQHHRIHCRISPSYLPAHTSQRQPYTDLRCHPLHHLR